MSLIISHEKVEKMVVLTELNTCAAGTIITSSLGLNGGGGIRAPLPGGDTRGVSAKALVVLAQEVVKTHIEHETSSDRDGCLADSLAHRQVRYGRRCRPCCPSRELNTDTSNDGGEGPPSDSFRREASKDGWISWTYSR